MKNVMFALVTLMLAAQLNAQPASPKQDSSSLDAQIEALQLDVPRIREIISSVALNEHEPTKQLHSEFWGLILTRMRADPAAIGASFVVGMEKGLSLQIAFWESLRLSSQSKRQVLTEDFLRLRNNYPASEITSDYAEMQDKMLAAAATGEPVTLRDGQLSYITTEIADERLEGMKKMEARFRLLFNPNWHH
jgi:hypothetical protein